MRINIPKSKKVYSIRKIYFSIIFAILIKKNLSMVIIFQIIGVIYLKNEKEKDSVFCHIYMENNHLKKMKFINQLII